MPPRETRDFGGREHVLEYGIVADFGLVRAHQGDRKGNLRFRLSARNFNPLAGMSGRRVFAEVQELIEVDGLHPDDIHLPGVFVDDVLLASGTSPKQPTIARSAYMTQRGAPVSAGKASPGGWRWTCATATSSTSAWAFRCWSRGSSRRAPRSSCTPRTACWAWARRRRPTGRIPT